VGTPTSFGAGFIRRGGGFSRHIGSISISLLSFCVSLMVHKLENSLFFLWFFDVFPLPLQHWFFSVLGVGKHFIMFFFPCQPQICLPLPFYFPGIFLSFAFLVTEISPVPLETLKVFFPGVSFYLFFFFSFFDTPPLPWS